MAAVPMEFLISTAEQHELFGDFLPASYRAEAAERWSGSPEWAETARRVWEYGLIEWQLIRTGQDDWERRLVHLLADGEPADGAAAMDLAEEQRRAIEHWFHPCPPARHQRLTEALLADASFRTRYEGLARGAADYLRAAVTANAGRRHW